MGGWAPAVSYQSQVFHASPLAYSAPWAYSPVQWAAPVHYGASPVVIGHGGVPIDTPEVQAARAAHLAAHTAITGVPQDTAEVQAAKAAHFAAHARLGHSLHKRSLGWYGAAAPVAIHNGVPLDTPEVQAARAAHFAAYNRALSGQPAYAPIYSHAPLGPDGRVVDTAEVAHAKAVHFAAVAKARSQPGYWDDGAHDGRYAYAGNWYGQHVPVIANGVPVETPEVQHAKAAHFAAHAEANARSHHQW